LGRSYYLLLLIITYFCLLFHIFPYYSLPTFSLKSATGRSEQKSATSEQSGPVKWPSQIVPRKPTKSLHIFRRLLPLPWDWAVLRKVPSLRLSVQVSALQEKNRKAHIERIMLSPIVIRKNHVIPDCHVALPLLPSLPVLPSLPLLPSLAFLNLLLRLPCFLRFLYFLRFLGFLSLICFLRWPCFLCFFRFLCFLRFLRLLSLLCFLRLPCLACLACVACISSFACSPFLGIGPFLRKVPSLRLSVKVSALQEQNRKSRITKIIVGHIGLRKN